MTTTQWKVGESSRHHYFADEDTEAHTAQQFAEGQLVKQGQGKARTYIQASHVQAQVTYRRKLRDNKGRTTWATGWEAKQREKVRWLFQVVDRI